MGKIDCVMEACQESYERSVKDSSIEIVKNCLKYVNLSLEEISKYTGVDLETIEELNENLD